ncbi:putative zinc-binding peptidase [Devosia sp. BK]|uniref:zinc-binding metallopeptidase family protein n=1 Tax=Devosia sp. BK TaxID=2871706 RepID=UPI00293AB9E3|nr:putative zinc-binding peptidase [Devosia sp. BK]MDV3253115.1 putative zinc-binding peptidase [Devosia sp. BK]
MQLFSCDHCGNTIYFENNLCEHCGHALGYLPEENALVSLDPAGDNVWTAPAMPGKTYIYCDNARHAACNWLVTKEEGGSIFCLACQHNETIPSLDDPHNLSRWQTIERAKKRLFYSLLRLGLPLETRAENPEHGLAFRFLADGDGNAPVMTGHENGIITISLAEADDAERERRRTGMGEPYRTLLGHFRHEIGHHYWDLLVREKPQEARYRELFGDERADYGQALKTYYANGAPAGWPATHISAYATAHPWEDFAETFAHYLHITDTVEMAAAFGIRAKPRTGDDSLALPPVRFDPYMAPDMSEIVDNWIPLASLLNNLNRAMGQTDAYPFVLSPPVIDKLAFVNDLVHQAPALEQLAALEAVE